VVIRTEDVDQVVEAALAFIEMICDVGCEVGLDAIFAHDDAIFFIAKVRCRKPGSTVLLIQYATFFEYRECVIDTTGPGEALFGIPGVERDSKLGEIFFDVSQDRFEGLLSNAIKSAFFRKASM